MKKQIIKTCWIKPEKYLKEIKSIQIEIILPKKAVEYKKGKMNQGILYGTKDFVAGWNGCLEEIVNLNH